MSREQFLHEVSQEFDPGYGFGARIARGLQLSRATVSLIMNGRLEPSADVMARLEQYKAGKPVVGLGQKPPNLDERLMTCLDEAQALGMRPADIRKTLDGLYDRWRSGPQT